MMWFSLFLRFQMVLLVLVLLLSKAYGELTDIYVRKYIMSEQCGSVVDFKDNALSAVRVQLTDSASYRPHLSCSFVLRAPPEQGLIMVVEWLDIAAGSGPFCNDFLSVWEGEFQNKTGYIEGVERRICGKEAPPSVTSQGRSVTLHFDSNTVEHGSGFSILFTAYHSGECTEEEFRCHNYRCIDERLKCDDDNNCGDDSDDCLVSISIAALVVLLVAIVGGSIAVAAVLYCNREKLFGKKGIDSSDICQPTTESTTASTIPDTNTV